ncbi:MAG: thermonuclease family protein [Chloroflexota bacterium]|nr:thermonuclease family protein [Chloroflexota bacterium]
MRIRICFCVIAVLSLAACAALSSQVNEEMAPRISTEVAVQVGTAVVEQVATVLAEGKPAEAVVSVSRPSESQPEIEALAEYDCVSKYCKDMSSCEEAVYQLTVCGYGRLDRNNDGIPCESICTASAFAAVKIVTPAPVLVEETAATGAAEIGPVTRVVDGDTIDVLLNGVNTRIRYLQMNTPERDEPCFRESTQANAELVAGQTVRLVPDEERVDRYDRLLRFIYVGDLLVNRALVEGGWAEAVLYPPNDAHYDEFLRLEQEAAAAGRGCHPTGIFDDGSTTR